jgi:hypothetical protein
VSPRTFQTALVVIDKSHRIYTAARLDVFLSLPLDARFEVYTAVKNEVEIFWAVTLGHHQSLHPEDGGSVDLRNFCVLPQQ